MGDCAPQFDNLTAGNSNGAVVAAAATAVLCILIALLWAYRNWRFRNRLQFSPGQSYQESPADAYIELDACGRCHHFHPVAPEAREWLVAIGGFVGKTIDEVLPADAAAVCHTLLRDAERFGQSAVRQIAFPTGENPRWFEVSAAKTTARNGWWPTRRFVLQSRDITPHVRADEEGKRSRAADEEIKEALLTATATAFLISDASGRCIDFDASAETLTGYQAQEIIGRNVFSLLVDNRTASVRIQRELRAMRGAPGQYQEALSATRRVGQFTLIGKNGQKTTIDLAIKPLCAPPRRGPDLSRNRQRSNRSNQYRRQMALGREHRRRSSRRDRRIGSFRTDSFGQSRLRANYRILRRGSDRAMPLCPEHPGKRRHAARRNLGYRQRQRALARRNFGQAEERLCLPTADFADSCNESRKRCDALLAVVQ